MVCDALYLQNEFGDLRFFFYVFSTILSFSTCSQSFKKSVRGKFWARTSLIVIHQIFSLPNFQNCACCEKNNLKNNKHNSLHLAQKYVQIFVLEHYLFLEAHSFLELRGFWKTVCLSKHWFSADKYPSIFPRQTEATIYIWALFSRLSSLAVLRLLLTLQFPWGSRRSQSCDVNLTQVGNSSCWSNFNSPPKHLTKARGHTIRGKTGYIK